ncbi:Translin-associated protein X like [Verticillium longisporum]|uniref:Translin-associated protein X like n=1 Tax=Verticillium longisporum TaxID=100787 RepID=A0A8I3AKS4_VERLO|nr:Translin-associated protein X like [Verticillium longisporum]
MSKRDRDGNTRPKDGGKPGPAIAESRFTPMFMEFRNELDEHHDRKERIVKASRDVTALSKKIIFACQRVNRLGDLPKRTQDEIDTRMSEIKDLLTPLEPHLTPLNRHRYASTLRGLEELVEALSFAHYLQHQTLITMEEAGAAVPAAIELTEDDYLYGIFDLFGEMMRFATVTTAQKGRLAGQDEGKRDILMDFHELSSAFEILPEIHDRTYRNKMEAMRQSVHKVEKLGYGIAIRGSERPKGWVPDMKDDVVIAD